VHSKGNALLITAIVYAIIGSYFMTIWATGKYKRYKREFDPKVFPGKRYKLNDRCYEQCVPLRVHNTYCQYLLQ
jgi:hypothetical protein